MSAAYVDTSVLAAMAFDDRQGAVATALGFVIPEVLYSP